MAVSSFGTMGQPPPWELQPDGSVLLIGAEPTGTGGVMKRIRASPAPGTSVTTWMEEVKSAKEKVDADAKAKKEKAEADRLAKKQADIDAAAKRKADAAAKKAEQEAARKAKTTSR
jgi:hypothetical protein